MLKWIFKALLHYIFAPNYKTVYVLSVHDGDTFTVGRGWGTKRFNVRLWGVDTPELKQANGELARMALSRLILGNWIQILPISESHKRKVCKAKLYDGRDLSKWLVVNGYAWDDARYSKGIYAEYQKDAKRKKRGIWKDNRAENPKVYRDKTKKPYT